MFNQNFIFSEKKGDRIRRHLTFWIFWWLYFGMLHAASPFGKEEISYFRNIPFTTIESLLFLIPQIVLAYSMLYFVLPRYILKKKYFPAFFWTVFFIGATAILNYFMIMQVNPKIIHALLPERFLVNTGRPKAASFFMALLASAKGSLTGTAFAVVLKLLKDWHLKEQRNLQLLKENTEAQLQLLTAQVHPHFLFNTLNNIYSQTQTESPKGSKMIMELSDMLRYILAEGGKPLVPLKKELSMIQDYINLEKVRYGNQLDLHLSVPQEIGNLQIAPLLLLPFVENSFKHGSSKFLRSPWINLKVEVNELQLFMKLMNGKAPDLQKVPEKSGIGIANVKKRLELLYKDKYVLQITDEEDVFVVNLWLELTTEGRKEPIQEPTIVEETVTKFNYV